MKKLRWKKASNGDWNCHIDNIPVVPSETPIQFIQSRLSPLIQEKINTIILFSLAPLYHLPILLEHSYKSRGKYQVLCLEKDQRILRHFERTFPKLDLKGLIFSDEIELVKKVSIQDPGGKVEIFIPGNLKDIFSEELPAFFHIISEKINEKENSRRLLLDRIEPWIKNTSKNFNFARNNNKKLSPFSALKNKAQDQTALFFCPGPGLEKGLNWLLSLNQDQQNELFIVCVNSALKPFIKEKIKVDAILVIESLDTSEHFILWEDFQHPILLTPHFVNPNVFKLPFKNHVLCQTQESQFNLPENGLCPEDVLKSGPTVATMGFHLCDLLGIKECFLFGLDLCFDGEKVYAQNTHNQELKIETQEGKVVLTGHLSQDKHMQKVFGEGLKNVLEKGEQFGGQESLISYDGETRVSIIPMKRTVFWLNENLSQFKTKFFQTNPKAALVDGVPLAQLPPKPNSISNWKNDFILEKTAEIPWLKTILQTQKTLKNHAQKAKKINSLFKKNPKKAAEVHKSFRESADQHLSVTWFLMENYDKLTKLSDEDRAITNQDLALFFKGLENSLSGFLK